MFTVVFHLVHSWQTCSNCVLLVSNYRRLALVLLIPLMDIRGTGTHKYPPGTQGSNTEAHCNPLTDYRRLQSQELLNPGGLGGSGISG